jgi:signal transduction histidine kinase
VAISDRGCRPDRGQWPSDKGHFNTWIYDTPVAPLPYFPSATVAVARVVAACDPAALERILVNVIDNAATHATGSGHIAVSVRFGRRLEIRVRDHDPGLAADVRHKRFVPFLRSAEAAAGAAPGVGLGLVLCRRLARTQGGDLRLERPDDGGVEAALELPLD